MKKNDFFSCLIWGSMSQRLSVQHGSEKAVIGGIRAKLDVKYRNRDDGKTRGGDGNIVSEKGNMHIT